MRKSTLKMEGSVKSNIEFPKYPHSAVIIGQTGSGKSVFVLDLLEKEYQGVFENIVILSPPWSGTRLVKLGDGLMTCVVQKTKA